MADPDFSPDAQCVQDEVTIAMNEFASFRAREGIFTRVFVMNNAKTMAPATWWSLYGKHFPVLSKIAQCVLAQPVSASAAERNWSAYGQVKTKARNRFGHHVADCLVYCHEALHLREKLQFTTYRQTPAEWDQVAKHVINDSDDSDDEDDAADFDFKKYAV
eukprot:4836782-Pleurochrysis_carterae.AAC.2